MIIFEDVPPRNRTYIKVHEVREGVWREREGAPAGSEIDGGPLIMWKLYELY